MVIILFSLLFKLKLCGVRKNRGKLDKWLLAIDLHKSLFFQRDYQGYTYVCCPFLSNI